MNPFNPPERPTDELLSAWLAGVNDGDDEVQGLLRLLRGRHLMLNLIPFNSVEGSGYERPPWDQAAEMTRRLNRGGVLTRLRRSAAQDVDGGCGQLRARNSTAAGKPVPVAVVAATTAAAAVAG